MTPSIRLISALLVLAMIGGRAIAAACEIACLSAAPVSQNVPLTTAKSSGHACHESAPESSAATAHVTARSHDGCHNDTTALFVLTAKPVRDSAASTELALSAPQPFVASVAARTLPEPTPPDLQRALVVPLRI